MREKNKNSYILLYEKDIKNNNNNINNNNNDTNTNNNKRI
jgi:hypothetical protein